ncbi:MAG: prenyltransferase/squalene oxidase repeat-containing protein, partial [Planctomycetota bacterium]
EGLPRTPGPTAMGLLCFLGYGCTTTHPPKYADTVTRALRTLLYCQRSDGSFISSSHGAYHSATATMAVCDAYSMMGDLTFHVEGESKSLKDAALRAFSFLCSEQNPNHGGYGYGCCTAGNDVSVGVWAYQGLMSGELSGFARPPSVKNRTATFLSYCLRDNGNWTPYRYTYNSSGYRSNGHDSESRNRMTAASLFIRLAFGGVAGQNDVEAPLNWLKSGDKYLSIAHRTGSNYDIYFVYYMTLALRMLGEPDWSNWKNEFLDNCRERQSADGHWEQTYVPYGQHGGDVYPTMLGCVALEAAVGDYLQGTKWCTAGEHSFGYNKLLGLDCISPAPDTILLMDYTRWGFEREDGAKHLAPRHDDRLNVLFGDGTVLPLTVESLLDDEGKLKEPLTTPQAD